MSGDQRMAGNVWQYLSAGMLRNPPEESVQAVSAAEKDLREKVRGLEDNLQQKFNVYDQKPTRETIEEMKEILSHRSYIQSFLRQIDNTLGRD